MNGVFFLFSLAFASSASSSTRPSARDFEFRGARAGDESVYVVKDRAYPRRGRFELTPMIFNRVNSKYSSYTGAALSLGYQFREDLGLEVLTSVPLSGLFRSSYSNLVTELFDEEDGLEPAEVELRQLAYFLGAGLHFSPLYGDLDAYDVLIEYDIYLIAGLGVSQTRERCVPVRDGNTCDPFENRGSLGTRRPARRSDEYRVSGHLGGGIRLLFPKRVGVRIELRDIVYTERAFDATDVTTDIANNLLVLIGASFLL